MNNVDRILAEYDDMFRFRATSDHRYLIDDVAKALRATLLQKANLSYALMQLEQELKEAAMTSDHANALYTIITNALRANK